MKRDASVARKYALALFRAASEHGAQDAVSADLTSLKALLGSDPRFGAFLAAPDATDEKKRAFVGAVLGGRVGPLVREFLDLLLAKGRFPLLVPAADHFQQLLEEARGIVRAQAVTAVPLAGQEREQLVAKLQRLTGKSVLMSESVDPRILGGVVVKLGGKIVDGSVRTALSELRESLLSAPLRNVSNIEPIGAKE